MSASDAVSDSSASPICDLISSSEIAASKKIQRKRKVVDGEQKDDSKKPRVKRASKIAECPCVKSIIAITEKPKREIGPQALGVLKLWRDVCKDVTGSSQVLRKAHSKYEEAKTLFRSRYVSSRPSSSDPSTIEPEILPVEEKKISL